MARKSSSNTGQPERNSGRPSSSVQGQSLSQGARQPLKVKVVIYENEEGGYTAQVPAIPGCVTEGDTREELLANLREAVEGCLLTTPGDFEPVDDTGREEEIEL